MTQELEYLPSAEVFTTFDLGLASALTCLGHELCAVDKTANPNKAQFVFRRDQSIDLAIESYWGGHLKLDARAFFDAIRCVKNQLYSN
jgi:hypothetical protein